MRNRGDKVSGLTMALIGGGSRNWVRVLMKDLALEEQLSGNVRLYDLDYQAAHENELIGNSLNSYAETKAIWKYKAVRTMEDVLTGADFVVISILPGTFAEMESDVHLPEEYGIYQSVGDSTGPGGMVRALRAVPMFTEFAENIKRYSPDAWVINYSNPMSVCTRALYETYPEVKAFGCCHEVFASQKLLAAMLKEMKGIDAARQDIKVNVLGINHFTWINKATYNGIDLWPLYSKFVDKYYEEGYGDWKTSPFATANRVKFDLFKRYGLMAAAGDRHLAEFCPPWYLKSPDVVEKWKFNLTPVSWRKNDLQEKIALSNRLVKGEERVNIKASGEEGVKQIKAILGLGDFVTNVNLPNIGQIRGLPLGAVVETNAVFSTDSVRPVMAGELPPDVHNLVIRNVINQETILKAAIKKDINLAFKAFANDPLMTAGISDAWELLRRMLENTRDYLPGWKL